MEPPQHILRALQGINPTLRLGWMHVPSYDVSQGSGCFVLLQLIPVAGASNCFRETWAQQGPVFGDAYHSEQEVPVLMGSFMAPEVFSGAFLPTVRGWHQDLQREIKASRIAKARQMDYDVAELAGMKADYMLNQARNSSFRPSIVPKKFVTEKDKAILRGELETYEDQERAREGSL